MSGASWEKNPILFGASYYREYLPIDRLEEDFDLMAQAAFSVIRVGDSLWSQWEPREGEYHLDFLQPVLDAAHARGIGVIICTPTYAVPSWLWSSYPAARGHRATGVEIPFGHRQNANIVDSDYRRLAFRLVEALVKRYRDDPAVIGWQVDNEPGVELLHNPDVQERFIQYLRAKYGSVGRLNREWGLAYWSHAIAEWDQLWQPDGNTNPSYDVNWRTFQASLVESFIADQAALVRASARSHQLITTCFALGSGRPSTDPSLVSRHLDSAAVNIYFNTPLEDATKVSTGTLGPDWATAGTAAGIGFQADIARGYKDERFMVTETNASSVDGINNLPPVYDGQLMLAAIHMVSHGAAMIGYWHWHTNQNGAENYWGGVLGHNLIPGRTFEQVALIGADFKRIAGRFAGYRVDAEVAILTSAASEWTQQFQNPFLNLESTNDAHYQFIRPFYDGLYRQRIQADIIPILDARLAPGGDLPWKVVVACDIYAASEELLKSLRAYADAGGHLVLGPRTGYADLDARPRSVLQPAFLAEAAGVSYTEYNTITTPVKATWTVESNATSVEATKWIDCLVAHDADILATYDDVHFQRYAAATTRTFGSGRITVVGCVPDPSLADKVAQWIRSESLSPGPWDDLPFHVIVRTGTNAAGEHLATIENWGASTTHIPILTQMVDIRTNRTLEPGEELVLAGWATATFTITQTHQGTPAPAANAGPPREKEK